MKHTNIAKVLGIAEVEDLQEGFHLQPEEAATVDAFIATAQVTQENFAALSIAAGALENNIVELKAAAVNKAFVH